MHNFSLTKYSDLPAAEMGLRRVLRGLTKRTVALRCTLDFRIVPVSWLRRTARNAKLQSMAEQNPVSKHLGRGPVPLEELLQNSCPWD